MSSTSDLSPALDDAVAALTHAASLRGLDPRTATAGVVGLQGALTAIGRMEAVLRSPDPAASAVDTELGLLRLRAARGDLLVLELARQRTLVPRVSDALAGLRTAGTLDDLVDAIPAHVALLGYERAMFSWVDDELWKPRSMHTPGGPGEAQAALAAGAEPYLNVRDLLEVDVVRRRRAILVLDCESNPRVHPGIYPVTQSRTYVAAPVAARNHVAGMVHADRNVDTGLTDEFDRQLLLVFCESLGALLDQRLALRAGDRSGPPTHVVPDWASALTEREIDVLRLVALGLTNQQIAGRLYVSPETTKSHLKNLMRKLGVRTRGEAAALFHDQPLHPAAAPAAPLPAALRDAARRPA